MESKELAGMHREELYRLVWETPMSRLAKDYGITDSGLAKICRRLKVPYPPRGWWAKQAAGHKVKIEPLPPAEGGEFQVIRGRRPRPEPRPKLDAKTEAKIEAAAKVTIKVPDRLVKPHPLVVSWLAEHERRKAEVRRDFDHIYGRSLMPAPFSDLRRRMHRIYDALFKVLEKHGGRVEDQKQRVRLILHGQEIEFAIREIYVRVRPPPEEARFGATYTPTPSNRLAFGIKTFVPGIRKDWPETERKRLEDMLPDILAALLAAAPILEEREREREEQSRRWAEERQREEESERARRLEEARWQQFLGFAKRQKQADLARSFLQKCKEMEADHSAQLGDRTLAEWMAWAEGRINNLDPLSFGVEVPFLLIAHAKLKPSG